MVRFDELQQLWQNQPQPDAVPLDVPGMADALHSFGRRQNIVNTFKVGLMGWQTWFSLGRLGLTPLTLSGQMLFLCGLADIVLRDWRKQLGIARLDFAEPSAGFVDNALEQLRDPNGGFRKRLWFDLSLIVIGINLELAGRWAALAMPQRLLSHLSFSLFPLVAFLIGFKIRAKRYALEYRPLQERLLAMKRALEEHAQ